MLMPRRLAGDPLVTLEAQLNKAVDRFQIGFVAPVDVVPSAVEIETVKTKYRQLETICGPGIGERESVRKPTYPSLFYKLTQGIDYSPAADSDGKRPRGSLCTK